MVADAGRREAQRKRKRIGGLAGVEPHEPRGHRGNAERRGEIGRPDAAVENARAVDGAAEPGHRLVAGERSRR